MALLDLPHGTTQINESRKFNGKWKTKWKETSFEATTTQEIHSRETEEEQPQMEVTEAAAAEPEAEQEEVDQMRDTDGGSAAAATPTPSAAYTGFEPPSQGQGLLFSEAK